MKLFAAPLGILLLFNGLAQGAPEPAGDLQLTNGFSYKEVQIVKVEPDGLRIRHRHGVGKIRMEDLPANLKQKYQLQEDQAREYRQTQKELQDRQDSAVRSRLIRDLSESTRAEQDAQARATRIAVFDRTRPGPVNYAELDEILLVAIRTWKEAGRADLAARLEEDRQLLKQQEIHRFAPAGKSRGPAEPVPGPVAPEADPDENMPIPESQPDLPPEGDTQWQPEDSLPPVTQIIHDSGYYPGFPIYSPIVYPVPVTVPFEPCPPGPQQPHPHPHPRPHVSPHPSVMPSVGPSRFPVSTPAGVTPRAVTPASISPASVTPASITPRSVTPASISPPSVTPRAFTPAIQPATPSPFRTMPIPPAPSSIITNSTPRGGFTRK